MGCHSMEVSIKAAWEAPAQPLVGSDSVVVEQQEGQGVVAVAGHQQLEALVPVRVPGGVGDGALQLAVRAQIHPARKPGASHDDASHDCMHEIPGWIPPRTVSKRSTSSRLGAQSTVD